MSHIERSEKTQALLSLSPETVDEGHAVQLIDDLIAVIRYHNEQYYVYAQPVIADVQYDHLFSLLGELEKRFPHFLRADSPTQRLNISLQEGFTKATHGGYQLLSLQNTYNAAQIYDRNEFLTKHLEEGETYSFIVEPKFDGSSVHLIYKDGYFAQAISRGDGSVGEDITENIKVVRNLPLFIPALKDMSVMRFRAEVLMPKKAFEQLNEYQKEEGLPLFANTRNATAGTLRQLDPQIVTQRNLVIFIHELLTRKEVKCVDHSEMFSLLSKRRLPYYRFKQFSLIQELVDYCIDEKTRADLLKENIEFDGLVIKVDNYRQREKLGSTAHHPRRAIAYKFPALQVATKLNSITYQVGRTGVITPVANLEPVQLSGALISKATLHNFDFICENDIRERDYVWIQRSGEVIPYVVGPIITRRTGEEKKFVIPTHCPSCGEPITQFEGEVAWYCTNENCDAQLKEKLKHFVSKGSMNIAGLGDSIIELLVDAKLVSTYVDLYTLHTPQKRLQMGSLPGIGEKKVEQILSQIELSKTYPVWRLLHALGISFVGKKVATMLEHLLQVAEVKNFEDFLKVMKDRDGLINVYGLGPQTINALYDYFSDALNVTLLKALYAQGVNFLPVSKEKVIESGDDVSLQGNTIVVTGTLPYPREKIVELLEEHGAKVTTSVTSKTSRLLAGEKAGSKFDKAQELQVPIYNREEAANRFPILATLSALEESSAPKNSSFSQSQSLFG